MRKREMEEEGLAGHFESVLRMRDEGDLYLREEYSGTLRSR